MYPHRSPFPGAVTKGRNAEPARRTPAHFPGAALPGAAPPGWAPPRGFTLPRPLPGAKLQLRGAAGHGDGSRQGPAAVRPRRGGGRRCGSFSWCRHCRAAGAFYPHCCRQRPSAWPGCWAQVTASLPGLRGVRRGASSGKPGSATPELPARPFSPCPRGVDCWFSLTPFAALGNPFRSPKGLWFPALILPQLRPALSCAWCSLPSGSMEASVFVEVMHLVIVNPGISRCGEGLGLMHRSLGSEALTWVCA